MIDKKKFPSLVVGTLLLFSLAARNASADPLVISISRTDAAFVPISTVTFDTAGLPVGFQDSATLSPGLIPVYNSFYSLGLAANPFAGTGVTWSVTAATNVPGTPSQGMLQTNTIDAANSSATTYYMLITVLSQPYTLPGSIGSLVDATTTFSNSGVSDGIASLISQIDNTPIGDVTFTGPGTSPTVSINYTRGGTYSIEDTFFITLNGHTLNDPSSAANITITTTVTPTSVAEPWNCASALAMALPIGLVYIGSRRIRSRNPRGPIENGAKTA